jgi:hypothetical protein
VEKSAGEQGTAALRIFISYRREDTSGHAGRLYDALGARFGAEHVFMDIDTIDLGVDFAKTIDRAVTSCDVVIALIGRDWATASDGEGGRRLDDPDDFVRLELESALACDVIVIPTCVQGAEIPPPRELPSGLAELPGRQGIELRDEAWHDDVARLIRRLERLATTKAERAALPSEPAEVPVPAPRTPRRWRSRKRLVAVGLALAVLAGAAAALAVALGGSGDGQGSAAEGTLLTVIPPVTRPSCTSIDYGEKSALVSVSCSGARLSATYHLFPSKAVMDDWYALQREEVGIAPDSGSCTGTAFRGEVLYGPRTGARYFCFVAGGEPNLVATDPRVSVGLEANIYEGTGRPAIESLLRQWRCCLQTLQPEPAPAPRPP